MIQSAMAETEFEEYLGRVDPVVGNVKNNRKPSSLAGVANGDDSAALSLQKELFASHLSTSTPCVKRRVEILPKHVHFSDSILDTPSARIFAENLSDDDALPPIPKLGFESICSDYGEDASECGQDLVDGCFNFASMSGRKLSSIDELEVTYMQLHDRDNLMKDKFRNVAASSSNSFGSHLDSGSRIDSGFHSAISELDDTGASLPPTSSRVRKDSLCSPAYKTQRLEPATPKSTRKTQAEVSVRLSFDDICLKSNDSVVLAVKSPESIGECCTKKTVRRSEKTPADVSVRLSFDEVPLRNDSNYKSGESTMSSGEKCGHNMERIPIDGCSDSKTSEPSKSTSSVSAVKKCYLRYASKCGVSLESTSKGRHQFAKTPGDVSTCNSSNSCHPKTPADVAVRLSFEDVLRMHSPRDPANLIGRKMGVDRVDVVAELDVRNVVGCLRAILAGLDGADLCRMAAVSRTWRRVCLNDSTANKRRVDHLNELNAKHAELGKENYGSSMKKKLNRSPSKTVKDSLNRKALAYRIIQPTVDPSMPAGIAGLQSPTKTCSRYQLYMQEASKLKVDETLKKCPRCLCPSLMKPAEERGCCTRDSCRYDYCVRCLCTYHGAEPCRLSSVVTAAKTPTKSTGGTRAVGTKKSKKNLRRL